MAFFPSVSGVFSFCLRVAFRLGCLALHVTLRMGIDMTASTHTASVRTRTRKAPTASAPRGHTSAPVSKKSERLAATVAPRAPTALAAPLVVPLVSKDAAVLPASPHCCCSSTPGSSCAGASACASADCSPLSVLLRSVSYSSLGSIRHNSLFEHGGDSDAEPEDGLSLVQRHAGPKPVSTTPAAAFTVYDSPAFQRSSADHEQAPAQPTTLHSNTQLDDCADEAHDAEQVGSPYVQGSMKMVDSLVFQPSCAAISSAILAAAVPVSSVAVTSVTVAPVTASARPTPKPAAPAPAFCSCRQRASTTSGLLAKPSPSQPRWKPSQPQQPHAKHSAGSLPRFMQPTASSKARTH